MFFLNNIRLLILYKKEKEGITYFAYDDDWEVKTLFICSFFIFINNYNTRIEGISFDRYSDYNQIINPISTGTLYYFCMCAFRVLINNLQIAIIKKIYLHQ